MSAAGVAHPVERHLAKVEVASSSLVTRSIKEGSHKNGGLSFMDRTTDFEKKFLQKRWKNYLTNRKSVI